MSAMNTQFCPILARFVDYYSLFWVPGLHSTMDEPRASLRVGHKYSQFWPILASFVELTVLGSRSDFHD